MERWEGRVALVTGASAGLGAAVCKALVGHGMTVIGCARRVDRVQAMADELLDSCGQLIPLRCDLRVESEILEMFDEIRSRFCRLDVCVNNAGLSHDSPLLSGTTEEWRDMLDVNVLALCICSREAVKLMREANVEDGQIIQISSTGGHQVPYGLAGVHFYCGTKFMVRAVTEGLRRELKEAGLMRMRTASISPGLVETEFLVRFMKDEERAQAVYDSMEGLQAEDVVESLLYILRAPPHVEVLDILVKPGDQRT